MDKGGNMRDTKSVIVSAKDIKNKVIPEKNAQDCGIYKTQNVYLSAFLISQDNFKLGKVFIEDLAASNRAEIEIEYDVKYKQLLDNYLDIYARNKAIVNLSAYQQNIRFIMHLVNKRKSGLED